jgi:hypothetical protein
VLNAALARWEPGLEWHRKVGTEAELWVLTLGPATGQGDYETARPRRCKSTQHLLFLNTTNMQKGTER